MQAVNRRTFLKIAGFGGVVFASRLARGAAAYASQDEFFFVQLSDTHWGYQGAANPDALVTLPKAVAAVNALDPQPDFIVFTGDLTHTTDDAAERRRRLAKFREIAGGLKNRTVRFMPGEHDASLDRGEAYREFFGATYYTFEHKGVHFIALDNVSDPAARIGEEQLAWLKADLNKQGRDELLMPHRNVTVFYGHIHQEHHYKTAHIEHHAARSLIFPLPAPGSAPKREPLKWDAAQPYRGLGFRQVEAEAEPVEYKISEFPVVPNA